jgi:hypothetical protein
LELVWLSVGSGEADGGSELDTDTLEVPDSEIKADTDGIGDPETLCVSWVLNDADAEPVSL